ncbi:MAG: FKBP-type peptidyl-prolyl cis-trans isomerase [Lachnospiraceae bacterium]|nr:FKBP-type peptidyl-prolyl cis-trans isomerase [Lachnospiraceae bacterium]
MSNIDNEEVKDAFDEAEETVEETVEEAVEETVEDAKDDAEDAVENATEELKEKVQGANDNKKLIGILAALLAVVAIIGIVLFAFRDKISNKLVGNSKDKEVYSVAKNGDATISNAYKFEDYIKLGNFKTIELKTDDIDETYNNTIDSTLSSFVTYKKIKEGKVKKNDVVNIYYSGSIDGKKFEGGQLTKKTNPDGYNLTIGSKSFIDDFEDQLIGQKIPSECKVKVKFPDNYSDSSVAGKKAVFKVTINYKQGDKITPEITDEFVKKNFSGTYDSADDMKDAIRNDTIKNLAWNAVSSKAKVKKYIDGSVDDMYNQLYATTENYLTAQGYKLSDYLTQNNMTSSSFKKQLTSTAENYVKNSLICYGVAQQTKIKVTKKEYDAKLKEYIQSYSSEGVKDEKTLKSYFKKSYKSDIALVIRDAVLTEKVRDYLAKNVKEV